MSGYTLTHRIGRGAAASLLIGWLVASPAAAQVNPTVRVARTTAVRDQPRGDSVVVGSVQFGETLEVVDRQGDWFLVEAPATKAAKTSWQRGWIHVGTLDPASVPAPASAKPRGRFMVRGFGQAGGTLFAASDSFDAILDSSLGSVYGGGGQVTFPNGAFVQASVDRFSKAGSYVLVSGTQYFTLPTPTRIVVTPVQLTAGYRSTALGVFASYLGTGVGWHRLEEEAPSLSNAESVSSVHVGFHVLGGAEFPLLPWLWIAGEVQWATVPEALGQSGVSAAVGEDDLGGTTFRFKVMVGR